ncbi:hypothetical protein KAJ83_01605 [Marivibrio halodurans]|uniref:N-acetyltransferase domain-containing protein n=1 Tax=Marivibrio halodurans TaxID=2039722 RepID=A0A8J7RZ07_9PROT|nr:hypothetical protein [Marivibrio halodurans]MBP5855688.1 hypothetical protein [Marivibrio halodurans]
MKVEFCQEPEFLTDFLAANDYPFDWPVEYVERVLICRLTTSDKLKTLGFVWFHWVEDAPDVLEFHICLDQEHRTLRLTRGVIKDLHKVADLCGAKVLMCKVYNKAILYQMLRLGWQSSGTICFTEIPNHWSN